MKRKSTRHTGQSDVEGVTRESVIAHLASLSRPASIREIAHGMGLRHRGRRVLPRVIQQLEKNREIDETYHGRYQLAERKQPHISRPVSLKAAHISRSSHPHRDRNLISGRVTVHRDGYGFLIADAPIPGVDGDLFLGRDSLDDAMHGDRVLARIERRRADGRAEGRVVQIVQREHPTVVGLFRYGSHSNHVLPYDTRILHEILIPPGYELTANLQQKLGVTPDKQPMSMRRMRLPELDGAVVDVEITRYPRGGLAPVGRVIEILGRPGEIGVDVEIVIRKHHLPHVFPADVAAEARATSQEVADTDSRGRRDFRNLPIVTIDGETARDFDDAVYVRRLPNGNFELQVHIADVAHYVQRGSRLDHEARLRGNSVYFPNRAVPMLPEELSNGICSLNPRVDRLVMSVLMEMDSQGDLLHAEFAAGVIRSSERMTYTNVNKILEGDPEMKERYAQLVGVFQHMKDLAVALNRRRNARGSIDFDLPEPVIEFDEVGRMLSIARSERNIAHRIIEEFMLAANEAVAQYLDRCGVASLHRIHEKPDPKKVLEFEGLAQAFGYSLGVDDLAERRVAVRHGHVRSGSRLGSRKRPMVLDLPSADEVDIRPQHYQRLTQKIAGKPEERILSYLMLRSLKQARYAAEPVGHFALAVREYTHFTSPIRRYPDLIVHRILKWTLQNPASFPSTEIRRQMERPQRDHAVRVPRAAVLGPYLDAELREVAAESSEAERRADAAERELMDWKTAQFMERHLGEEYEALIISVQKFGFFVELLEIFVEGLVGIDRLEDSTGLRCTFREHDHAIVAEPYHGARGPRRRLFRLGDRLSVRAERIDPLRHRVEFSVVEGD